MVHSDGRHSARAQGDDRVPPAGPAGTGSQPPRNDGPDVGPAHPADRQRQRVKPGTVIAAAARALRRYWLPILAVAIPVSVVGSGLEVVIDHYVDPSDGLLSVGATLGSTGVTLLGTVLLSGFVGRLVGAAEHGREPMTFVQIARSLPWRRLIAADVLFAVAVVAGLVLLVLPGLAALTLLAVIGPVIEIEHRRVFEAARRSVQLTRRHLGSVVLLATIPLVAASQLEAIAPEPHEVGEIVGFLLVRGLAEGVVEACVAALLVELCFRLIEAAPRSRRGARGPVAPP
jgi:hypothetical protein